MTSRRGATACQRKSSARGRRVPQRGGQLRFEQDAGSRRRGRSDPRRDQETVDAVSDHLQYLRYPMRPPAHRPPSPRRGRSSSPARSRAQRTRPRRRGTAATPRAGRCQGAGSGSGDPRGASGARRDRVRPPPRAGGPRRPPGELLERLQHDPESLLRIQPVHPRGSGRREPLEGPARVREHSDVDAVRDDLQRDAYHATHEGSSRIRDRDRHRSARSRLSRRLGELHQPGAIERRVERRSDRSARGQTASIEVLGVSGSCAWITSGSNRRIAERIRRHDPGENEIGATVPR